MRSELVASPPKPLAGVASRRERGNRAARGPVERPESIDGLDRAIIEALQENGRESFRHIAEKLGVSEATVRNRYARLTRANVLQVTGVTNPLGLGFDAQAMLGIKTSGRVEEVADEIASWREADYVVVTAGQFDLLVEVVCADKRHLLDMINRIRAIPSVVSTESFVYLQLWKQLYDWGARPNGAQSGNRAAGNGRTRNRRSK
jgi:Lrp/AsnC family transcriptional regulator for asnA, asnC and gidA